jgi:putative flippase GtrA
MPMQARATLDRMLPPRRRAAGAEFHRFGVVGSTGLVVDTAVLCSARSAGAGLYGGRILSYVAAATATWTMNRVCTLREARNRPGGAPPAQQWALLLAVNLAGFLVKYGTYVLRVGKLPPAAAHPVLALAAGALAGMGGNFLLSRRYVFRSP